MHDHMIGVHNKTHLRHCHFPVEDGHVLLIFEDQRLRGDHDGVSGSRGNTIRRFRRQNQASAEEDGQSVNGPPHGHRDGSSFLV